MTSRSLQQTRTWTVLSVGLVALAESLNRSFLRPAIKSRTYVVHSAIALFGATSLTQAYLLNRSRSNLR